MEVSGEMLGWAGQSARVELGATERKSLVSDPKDSSALTAAGWHTDMASGIGARYTGASFQPHPALRATLGTLPDPSLGPQCVPSLSGLGPEGTVRVQWRKLGGARGPERGQGGLEVQEGWKVLRPGWCQPAEGWLPSLRRPLHPTPKIAQHPA